MGKRLGRVVVVLLVAVLVAGTSLGAARPQAHKVGVGKLSGVVTSSAGKVLADMQLRLMKDGKLLSETRSDKTGKFAFKNIVAGKYMLLVGSERGLNFEADKGVKVNTLSVVVPQRERENYSAALTQTQWVWVGVGTAGAAAVAVPVVHNTTNAFGGGTHHSP